MVIKGVNNYENVITPSDSYIIAHTLTITFTSPFQAFAISYNLITP